MLVLKRRVGESIVIDNNPNFSVTILSVNMGWVRLGIKAPKDIRVDREEIYKRIILEKQNEEKDDDNDNSK